MTRVRVMLGPGLAEGPVAGALVESAWELRFATMLSRPAVLTRGFIGALLVVHIGVDVVAPPLLLGAQRAADSDHKVALLVGAKVNALIEHGEVWRLVSSTLLHGGVLHLALNLMALFILGRIVENALGRAAFATIYLGGALTGAIASYGTTEMPSVGASGAIFGLLGAAAAYGIDNRARIPARLKRLLVVTPLIWIALNLALTVIIPGIDMGAHAGGLLWGIAVGPLLGDAILRRPARVPALGRHALLAALGIVFLAGAGAMAPRVVGQVSDVSTRLAPAKVWPDGRPMPARWAVGLWTGRDCVSPDDPNLRRMRAPALPCFHDPYGSLLLHADRASLHAEERWILAGNPSRSPEAPYLIAVDGDRATPVWRRRDSGNTPYAVLMATGGGERVYLLRVPEPLIQAYLPLIRVLVRADVPRPAGAS